MARSLKKGPYVFDRLMNTVIEMNKNGKSRGLFSDLMDDLVISHVLSNNKLIKLTLRSVQLQNSLFFLI